MEHPTSVTVQPFVVALAVRMLRQSTTMKLTCVVCFCDLSTLGDIEAKRGGHQEGSHILSPSLSLTLLSATDL